MKKLISIVVPMYNEQPMVPYFLTEIAKVIASNKEYDFEVVAVNDGSKDETLTLLYEAQTTYKFLRVVNLSRNFGHEPAVAAGIKVAKGVAIIPLDADLQDPPEVISAMLKQFELGYDVVNARRASRKEDKFIKRYTAGKFYKVIDKMSGKVRVPQNVGHYRLISRRVADHVNALTESTRVFRVQVPYVGFKTCEVAFVRPERSHGETHYNMKSMIDLALNAIVSTTTAPLRFIFKSAVWLFILTMLSGVTELIFYLALRNIFVNHTIWLLANIGALLTVFLLANLSILALYIEKTFIEAQNRPFYVIESVKENN